MDDWARLSQYKNGDQYKNGTNQYKNGASQWKIGANIKMVQANIKMAQANIKMVQAIFLPGAWGKIPVFMGKNHPTPGAAMAFLHALNYPSKT